MAAAGEMHRHAGNEAADRHCGLGGLSLAPRPGQRDDLVLVLGALREGGIDGLAAGDDPLPDRDIEVFDRRAVELRQYRFERPLGELVAVLAERLLQDRATEVAPRGKAIRSPFGVKAKTWSWNISSLVCSRNSSGPDA